MPLYEFHCAEHGPFQAIRPMSASKEPCDCPTCGASAPRALATPMLRGGDRAKMNAHAVNERASHEPKRASQHGPGCGCCSGKKKKSSGTFVRPDGSKSFPAKRPWMISH